MSLQEVNAILADRLKKNPMLAIENQSIYSRIDTDLLNVFNMVFLDGNQKLADEVYRNFKKNEKVLLLKWAIDNKYNDLAIMIIKNIGEPSRLSQYLVQSNNLELLKRIDIEFSMTDIVTAIALGRIDFLQYFYSKLGDYMLVNDYLYIVNAAQYGQNDVIDYFLSLRNDLHVIPIYNWEYVLDPIKAENITGGQAALIGALLKNNYHTALHLIQLGVDPNSVVPFFVKANRMDIVKFLTDNRVIQ